MSHEITCKNCKWSTGFPVPSEPMPADRPDTFLERWFGSRNIKDDFARLAHYRHRNIVQCQRFPRRENMNKNSVCGEFLIRADPEGDKK